MSSEKVKKVLWWLCLFVAPLTLLTIELFHPAGFTKDPGMYQYLSAPQAHSPEHHALAYFGPDWWFLLHMIQTPMVGLVAIGLWLLLDEVNGGDGTPAMVSAWISRAATFVFLIFYTALDAIGGIGLGRVIEITQGLAKASPPESHLTPDQLSGVVLVLNTMWTDAWVGGVGSFVSMTGSWAAFIAVLFAAIALLVSKRVSWPPLVVLLAFGWQIQLSHASFHGPVAFGLLIVAALWIWWQRRGARTVVAT